MADNNINAGQNIGFKVGSQESLNTLLGLGTSANAVEGTFYLTHDTHRLYIGNRDHSLSAINEGVITVADMTALNAIATSGANTAGQFYYVTGSNILCVYNGSRWVQINSNTDSNVSAVTVNTSVASNVATIKTTVSSSDGSTSKGEKADDIAIEGSNGITITKRDNATSSLDDKTTEGIIISGDTYTLSSATGTTTGTVDIKLDSANTTNDSSINLAPANYTGESVSNVTLSNNSGVISIAAKDSVNDSVTVSNQTAGFKVVVKDNHNHETTGGTFDPKITVGVDSDAKKTVSFVSGTASLDVYTKDEIDKIAQGLNAMTYRGTVGTSGTAGSAVVLNSDSTKVTGIKDASGNNLTDIKVGDTFLLNDAVTINGVIYKKGSLLIATGTEDTSTGYITAATLGFDVVQESGDTDTTYKFQENSTQDGIKLVASNSGEVGSLAIKGGTVTYTDGGATKNSASVSVSNTGSSGVNEVLTITHDTVTRNDTTASASVDQLPANSTSGTDVTFTIPVITKISSDSTGHITGIETTDYKIKDTNGAITSNAFTTAVNTDNTVGTITNTITFTEGSNHQVTTTGTTTIESSSLKVEANTANTGLAINMVWGSF